MSKLECHNKSFLRSVYTTFGTDFLHTDPEILSKYGRDWTKRHTTRAQGVVFPRKVQEVAQFLKICEAHRVPVVPSGGRTGLAGGALAIQGEFILSLDRMNQIYPLNELGRNVRVQAGVITEHLQNHCDLYGLMWPIDLAAKGSSQIGGNIATNAGGMHVLRYGMTRNWILGLQVVTMAGEILELGKTLEKCNLGCDLKQLFIGSEGCLGVITEAELKLVKKPKNQGVLLLAVSDITKATHLLKTLYEKSQLPILAFEWICPKSMSYVCRQTNISFPFDQAYGGYICGIFELAPDQTLLDSEISILLEDFIHDGFVENGIIPQSSLDQQQVWAIRENITEALHTLTSGNLHKNDIAVPIHNLSKFIEELDNLQKTHFPDMEMIHFGHLGDGNLHINWFDPKENGSHDHFWQKTREINESVFRLVDKYKGSISAEHGIGLLKREALKNYMSSEEQSYLLALKKLWDPHDLLNPGKTVPT